MVTSVNELDLPEVDVMAESRSDLVASVNAAREKSWLGRGMLGPVVLAHNDVVAVLRDRRFESAMSMFLTMFGVTDQELIDRIANGILALEGPAHSRLRRLVAPAFTNKAADRLRPFMREVVGEIVDAVAPTGRCDVVAEICEPYPVPIICQLLGAPREDWKRFSSWTTDIFKLFSYEVGDHVDVINSAFRELDDYIRAMVKERRGRPSDDLLTTLIAAEEEGDRLSIDELVMMAGAVLTAGTDTTRNQLACAVALFAEHPEQWALLAREPQRAPAAVEEVMRHLGAVPDTVRVASEDIEYRDVLFPAGTVVMTAFVGANFDPDAFPEPMTFDITREHAAPQMTFGSGIHHCLGSWLARAELQEALPILARSLPDLRIDGDVEWKASTNGIYGPARLPVTFSARTASA